MRQAIVKSFLFFHTSLRARSPFGESREATEEQRAKEKRVRGAPLPAGLTHHKWRACYQATVILETNTPESTAEKRSYELENIF